MAVTKVSNTVDRVGFCVNFNSADLSGCEELIAAVSGKSIYVERLELSFGAAINVTLGAGETGGAVTTILIGPIYGAANGFIPLNFEKRPIKATTATSLTIDASGAGNITGIVSGYIK